MNAYFILIILLLFSLSINAQEVKLTEDLEGWTSIGVEKKIKEKYTLLFEEEARFSHSLTKFRSLISEVKLVRDCGNNLEIGVTGRHKLFNSDENQTSHRTRYGSFIRYRFFKTELLKVHGTIKYLKEFNNSLDDYNTYWRFKVKMGINLKKGYKPFISSEIFRVQEICRSPYFETHRMWVGTKKKLNKGAISLAFGYDRELKSEYPKTTWLIKVKYFIDFK